MSGSVSTFIQASAIPATSSAVMTSSLPPLKILIPPNASKAISPGAKSRMKTTPRRGKIPGATVTSSSVHEQSVYTQAVSSSTPNAVSAVARPLPPTSVPVVLNPQSCSVLLVSDTPSASSSTVAPLLVSNPASSQAQNATTVQTTFVPNPVDASSSLSLSAVLAKASRPAKIVYTMANSSHAVAQPSSAAAPKPGGVDVKPEVSLAPNSTFPTSTFQATKLKNTLQRQTKPKVDDAPKTKPVRPKGSVESVVIDLCDLCDTRPATPSAETSCTVIQADHTFAFHNETTAVSDPPSTGVGYAINITDILPPKPNQAGLKFRCPAPPKLKPINVSSTQALPPMSTLTQAAQLIASPPKDVISVKCQSKMMASSQPAAQLRALPVNTPVTSSFIQLQSPVASNGDSDDISVIPITILGGHGQPSVTFDSQGIHTPQFLSHGLPQLVPIPGLVPTPTSVNNAVKAPKVCGVAAPLESVEVVEVISLTRDNDTHLRVAAGAIGELHPGLNRSVPEPYATDLLSQLTEDGALPAISSSQVSSLLSALDSQQPDGDNQQHVFQSEAPPPSHNQTPQKALRKRAPQRKPKATKSDKGDANSEAVVPSEEKNPGEKAPTKRRRKAKATDESKLVERVQCFKCRFCLFLTLDKDSVTKHIEEEHSSYSSNSNENGAGLPCPGCSNIFLSKRSLSVHLTEDHRVAVRELNDIMSAMSDSSDEKKTAENESKQAAKKPKQVKEKAKRSPKTSAKIRVRNLLTSPSSEDVETLESVAAQPLSHSSPSKAKSTERKPRLVGDRGRPAAKCKPDVSDKTSEAAEVSADDSQSEPVEIELEIEEDSDPVGTSSYNFEYDDHDYTNIYGSSNDSPDGAEARRKRRRGSRPRTRAEAVKKARKRKAHQADCETKDCEDPVMQNSYKCNVAFCAIRMRAYDKLVYHQRCHKEKPEAKSAPQDVKVLPSAGVTDKVEDEIPNSVGTDVAGDEATPSPVSRKTEYCCPECGLILRNWVQMSGHLWRAHTIDMELHSCDQCDYKTPSMSNLVNLHRRTHSIERPFACDSCDKSFKTTKQLRNHKVTHTNKMKAAAGDASSCSICGRLFADARLLRSHVSAVHIKLRPFRCSICGYSASSKSTLKMHVRQHTGEKPFHCDECSYMTADHNSLRRHKKRHSGDKPYKCPHCLYACIQSSTYKVHLRTKHPGQGEGLMFSCQNCPFHTISHDIYRAHLAQHIMQPNNVVKPTGNLVNLMPKPPVKSRFHLSTNGNSDHAVATAAVSEHLPIILSFSTEDAHASEAPNMHSVVDEVSEAIIPGSDLHLLYSNFSVGSFSQQQSSEGNNTVIYNSQNTQDFVMSMLSDPVIQVVGGPDNNTQLVTLAEERITGDLGELQDNNEDLKFKLCEEVVRS